ncbi:hypothetical protein C2G38_2036228 [Gigaspora rosea]|uniref:Uncharacterized protein n=1 Tax=Gigaspora rosea TaxID=44941 RepID=A0A397VB05_9GLOM|nr:hypothetical protein C2G38_2036228 [Gigaspora rosea]
MRVMKMITHKVNKSDQSDHSDQSDQDNYEINEANDFYSKEHEQNKEDEINDPIQEIFNRVFINDSWTCDSLIEKLYYSAKIYPAVCYLCGSLEVGPSATPVCNNCAGTNSPTKHCGKQSFNKLKKIRT